MRHFFERVERRFARDPFDDDQGAERGRHGFFGRHHRHWGHGHGHGEDGHEAGGFGPFGGRGFGGRFGGDRWWGDEEGGRGFGHGGGGRGGRGGRTFENGDLRFLILALLADKPSYGYDIIKAIGERVGGGYSPSPGVVYPTLTLLEEMGLATVSPGEGAKKLYAITDEGRAHLAANAEILAAIEARLEKISAARGWAPPASILRAMENLRMALRLRLKGGGQLSPEQVRAITDALDAAARAVEEV